MNLANRLTMLRILLVPVFVAVFYIRSLPYWNYWAAAVFVLAFVTDIFDGRIARKRNMVTDFGRFLDPIADKLLMVAGIVLLVGEGKFPAIAAIIIIAREFIVSGIRMICASGGVVVSASWLGKVKTITQVVAVTAVLLDNVIFESFGIPFSTIMVYASLLFTLWSGVDYFIKNRGMMSWGSGG